LTKIEKLEKLLEDICEEDEEIRETAVQVLSRNEVYGDSFGVPMLTDIVESLVARIKK